VDYGSCQWVSRPSCISGAGRINKSCGCKRAYHTTWMHSTVVVSPTRLHRGGYHVFNCHASSQQCPSHRFCSQINVPA
jgi:hypothetical protein